MEQLFIKTRFFQMEEFDRLHDFKMLHEHFIFSHYIEISDK